MCPSNELKATAAVELFVAFARVICLCNRSAWTGLEVGEGGA